MYSTGPVASHIKSEAFRTGNELRDLSYSRTARSMKTATGQPLTRTFTPCRSQK